MICQRIGLTFFKTDTSPLSCKEKGATLNNTLPTTILLHFDLFNCNMLQPLSMTIFCQFMFISGDKVNDKFIQ